MYTYLETSMNGLKIKAEYAKQAEALAKHRDVSFENGILEIEDLGHREEVLSSLGITPNESGEYDLGEALDVLESYIDEGNCGSAIWMSDEGDDLYSIGNTNDIPY